MIQFRPIRSYVSKTSWVALRTEKEPLKIEYKPVNFFQNFENVCIFYVGFGLV